LKIERAAGRAAAQLVREAAVLAHLDGDLAPRLLGAGELDGRRFLALAWLPGADALTAAAELRRRPAGGDRGDRDGLLALGRSIAAAYAGLHARGVIHGDVHPRNVLVAPGGGITLIDFGLSGLSQQGELPEIAGRGGVAFYFEPEYA